MGGDHVDRREAGCTTETSWRWVRQAERDADECPGLTTDERQRLKRAGARGPRVEARQRDSAEGIRIFRPDGVRPPAEVIVACVDAHREAHGIEPIGRQLAIARSTYYRHKHQQAVPTARSARAQRDDELRVAIRRVRDAHFQVYGRTKV